MDFFGVAVVETQRALRRFGPDAVGTRELRPILDALRAIGYEGYVSLELMNPQIWRVPARQLGEIGMTALRAVLGQASMADS